MVRTCQPTFSAALLGYVEAALDTDDAKNRMCSPIPAPNVPADLLKMMETELANRLCWSNNVEIGEWITNARLDQFMGLMQSRLGVDKDAAANIARYAQHVGPAAANLENLLAG